MEYCTHHREELGDSLRHKGLWGLVKPHRAAHFARRWLDGKATRDEFDPLVVSMLEINKKAVECFGAFVCGDQCPLCTAERVLQNADAGKAWTDNVTDLMLLAAKVNGLVPMSAEH